MEGQNDIVWNKYFLTPVFWSPDTLKGDYAAKEWNHTSTCHVLLIFPFCFLKDFVEYLTLKFAVTNLKAINFSHILADGLLEFLSE